MELIAFTRDLTSATIILPFNHGAFLLLLVALAVEWTSRSQIIAQQHHATVSLGTRASGARLVVRVTFCRLEAMPTVLLGLAGDFCLTAPYNAWLY